MNKKKNRDSGAVAEPASLTDRYKRASQVLNQASSGRHSNTASTGTVFVAIEARKAPIVPTEGETASTYASDVSDAENAKTLQYSAALSGLRAEVKTDVTQLTMLNAGLILTVVIGLVALVLTQSASIRSELRDQLATVREVIQRELDRVGGVQTDHENRIRQIEQRRH